MAGTKYKTQPRVKGRFAKISDLEWWERTVNWSGLSVYQLKQDETPIKIGLGVRLAVWLSHNRLAVAGYVAYVVLCLCAGIVGALIGVRLG